MATAALSPSWASEMTSLTPRRPRRASLRRKSLQNVSASEGQMSRPSTSRRPSPLTPMAMTARRRDDATAPAHLQIGRVEPDIGPVAFDRAAEEGFDLLVDLLAQPADLALGDAVQAHRLNEVVDRAGRDALDVGLLHDRRDGLLRHPPRLEKAREIAALAQLGNAQLHRSGARLPVAVAVAVALSQAIGRTFAMRRARAALNIQLHQPLGREADHLGADNPRRGSFPKASVGPFCRRSSSVPRLR